MAWPASSPVVGIAVLPVGSEAKVAVSVDWFGAICEVLVGLEGSIKLQANNVIQTTSKLIDRRKCNIDWGLIFDFTFQSRIQKHRWIFSQYLPN